MTIFLTMIELYMKVSNPVVFVDTSFFKAVIDVDDDFHQEAVFILNKLKDETTELVTTNFIIDESLTLIRVRLNLETAIELKNFIETGLDFLKIMRVTVEDELHAWKYFLKPWKGLSFTDCTSFALMKRLGLTRVATFDGHFRQAGFTIE